MSQLSQRLAQLSPELRAKLLQRIDTSEASPAKSTITPVARDTAAFPLSFAQQRLWFLDQLQGNPTYNIPLAIRLDGPLQPALLELCLNEIIQRHEVLRTTFQAKNGQPFQVIAPSLTLFLTTKDLTMLPESERESELQQLAIKEARTLFRLSESPLVRSTLLRLGATEHVLLLTQHHIISDGWSLGVWLQEIAVLYEAHLKGQTPYLPPLPFQYVDYTFWQRQWLSGTLLTEQIQYWVERLKDAPTVIEIPSDHPRPAVPTFRGARQPIVLPQHLNNALQNWSQQEGVTLFMVLLAAWNILLYRYSGSEDILVGSPVANRTTPDLEKLVGFFVNTLVLRTDLSGNPTVRELLQRVRETALGAFAHQDLPFEQIVEELHLERDMSRTVLIQSMLAWQNTPRRSLECSGLVLEPVEIETGTAKFDLLLALEDSAQGICGALEYNTDIFEGATIARMAGQYQRLLEEMLAQPEQQIASLPLLTAHESEQVVVEWNATERAYAQDLCIHQLFENQVERTPQATALLFQDQMWTYQELNQRANQLAHRLRDLGIGPGKLVAVYMDRSLEMLPALLGILKAGGAYVPLEAHTPAARLHWILDSLQVTCLLTQQALCSQLLALDPLPALEHIFFLDAIEPGSSPSDEALSARSYQIRTLADLDQMPQHNPLIQGNAEDLAYIIFTSGSTGTPKGVMVAHSPVINLIEWVNRTFEVGPPDRVLFITSLCFDLSVYDIFGILAAGGSIRIATAQDVQEPVRLLDLLETGSITFWDSAPAALLQLTPFFSPFVQDSRTISSTLRLVFLSGDWIPVSLPDQLKAVFPMTRVISLGGATEATVWSNYYPIEVVDPRWPSIPYGKPIQNAQYYVLDDHLSPCPIGVPGHLYIGGLCLSMGYVNEPELTRTKFLPSPFHTQPGARIYKTGDLARWRADGNLEFLGRSDSQVKIRGFRIELGEIEAVLRQHPAIEHAIVQAYGDAQKDRRLVAYIVAQGDLVAIDTELRAFLHRYLPEYMVPAAFLFMETLPVTSNGKLDRQKLPAPDFAASQQEAPFVAPRDAIELQLSLLWEEILQVSPISITANFFELGGHSLLAVQLMARIKQQFDQEFPLALLFQQASIERFATLLRQSAVIHFNSPVVGLQTSGTQAPLFFAHPGGGSAFCYVALARFLGQDRPFYGIQTPGLNDDKKLYTDVQLLAAHYVQEIRVIQPTGPYHLGGWCVGGIIAYEMARQLQEEGQEVALLALLDSAPPSAEDASPANDVTLFTQFAWDLGRLLGRSLPASYKIALLALLGDALPTLDEEAVDSSMAAAFIADLLAELQGPDGAGSYEMLKQLTLNEQLHHLSAQVKEAHIDASETELAYLRHLSLIYSTNVRAVQAYVPQIYTGDITLFRASDEIVNGQDEPVLAWEKLTTSGVTVYTVPGDHYSILKDANVSVLADKLKEHMK
jgi:amino acid adenylation domain-containing protein